MTTKDSYISPSSQSSEFNSSKGRIVVFGAGATGRAHVGLLAWQAGYEIVFVDKDLTLVNALQASNHYTVKLFNAENGIQSIDEVDVTGFKVFPHTERELIASEIVDADLVLTAVFDQNLGDVAITIARAVHLCRENGRQKPLNVIACENMMDSSSSLRKHVERLLDDEDRSYSQQYFGFPDCMISRVVPRPESDPLNLVTENYNEWTVRAETFKGEKIDGLDVMELVTNQTARLERKLFIHNGGHAVCGYLGFHRGHQYIHEAVADPFVAERVMKALNELGDVVRQKHGFSSESIEIYKMDLVRRGSVPEMKDEILRVVRDPIRKLSPNERLVAPAKLAEKYQIPRQGILMGIVGALKYTHPGDEQSRKLTDMIENDGLQTVLENICQIGTGSSLAGEVKNIWENWSVKDL
jgi:mannitol-1-phosphate 5-dehydrogenase